MSTKKGATRPLLTPQLVEALSAEGLEATVEVKSVRGEDVDERLAAAFARLSGADDRMETLAAVGQVGAGVTHEVRNVMTGILGFAQLARGKAASKPEKTDELLQLIEKESMRCLDILTQYLSFTRPRAPEHAPVDLSQVVAGVDKLVHHHLHLHKVKLHLQLAADLPAVRGDAGALKQVLLNLIMNAMHAMKTTGGTVRIVGARHADGAAQLHVQDDGPGGPAALAGRSFDPFFSTKPVGEGTGMGLSVSRTIVEQHGGTLSLDGNGAAMSGATFTLYLPALGA